jgi:integrase/recombinase XerD
MGKKALVPASLQAAELIPTNKRESLVAWFNLYLTLEGAAGSANTLDAKKRDLGHFLSFFLNATGGDHPDQWTRSLTAHYLRQLVRGERKSPTTVNRRLATLRHTANWVDRQRPFLAGNPCSRIHDLDVDDPEWKGLSDIEVTRLKSAAEQLIHIDRRRNQTPIRDFAIFLVLLHTGLRISELLELDLDQYQGKHLVNVKRKGKKVTRKVFLAKDARESLDRYIDEVRGTRPGPLVASRTGKRLARQNVDDALKRIAKQANARLPQDQQIHLSAHLLRHTMLRKAAEKYGVEYAMELAGHTSSRYIWRYVQPSQEQKEAALEDLF